MGVQYTVPTYPEGVIYGDLLERRPSTYCTGSLSCLTSDALNTKLRDLSTTPTGKCTIGWQPSLVERGSQPQVVEQTGWKFFQAVRTEGSSQ